MNDFLIRAIDRDTFLAVGESQDILSVGENGEIIPNPGVHVDEIGPHERVPAELDADGNIVTPAVVDTRWHVNIRISDPATDKPDPVDPSMKKFEGMMNRWKNNGRTGKNNASEKSWNLNGVELVEGVQSPSRVWL